MPSHTLEERVKNTHTPNEQILPDFKQNVPSTLTAPALMVPSFSSTEEVIL